MNIQIAAHTISEYALDEAYKRSTIPTHLKHKAAEKITNAVMSVLSEQDLESFKGRFINWRTLDGVKVWKMAWDTCRIAGMAMTYERVPSMRIIEDSRSFARKRLIGIERIPECHVDEPLEDAVSIALSGVEDSDLAKFVGNLPKWVYLRGRRKFANLLRSTCRYTGKAFRTALARTIDKEESLDQLLERVTRACPYEGEEIQALSQELPGKCTMLSEWSQFSTLPISEVVGLFDELEQQLAESAPEEALERLEEIDELAASFNVGNREELRRRLAHGRRLRELLNLLALCVETQEDRDPTAILDRFEHADELAIACGAATKKELIVMLAQARLRVAPSSPPILLDQVNEILSSHE